MDVVVTIQYTTDSNDTSVNDSIMAILENTLPYMVDNVSIDFDVENE